MRLPGVGDGSVVRTFDAPEAMGINFHEIRARSALNHVPGGRYGFSWTINPYRGCTHACSYCGAGETPILMADGGTRPLGDIQVGDEIYGTVRRSSYRRYVKTRVEAHWSTRKEAYRVTLEDGTELVASGDHRFLTNRGWKYVTGAECGPAQRPFLTTNNELLGFGALGSRPGRSAEYRRGYLCGMIRGDGSVGSYSYLRRGGSASEVHQFRLALADWEGLYRTKDFLADEGVLTNEFQFTAGNDCHRPLRAIRAGARDDVDRIRDLIQWPGAASQEWSRGFLAGIFDAEGCRSGALRIANKDSEMIGRTFAGLRDLGFASTIEAARPNGLRTVRLLGGLREQLRFFQQIDPAITRKRSIEGIAIKSDARLGVVEIEPLGCEMEMFDITTGTGDFIANGVVSHNCFARKTHTYLDMDAGRDFEREIVVKVNVPELLRNELARPSWKRELVALGTNTDPYQWVESRYLMMPEILEALGEAETPVSVLTKSPLVMRDVKIYQRLARQGLPVSVNLSVPTLDEDAWRATEPHTPSPAARLDAVAELRRRGIDSGVLIAPLMPGINDDPEQVRPIVERARKAGATFLGGVALHLRGEVKDVFFAWLQAKRPDLLPRYEALYEDRAYMKPEQRKQTTRALQTWGRQSIRRNSQLSDFRDDQSRPSSASDGSLRADGSRPDGVAVGDSGGGAENENLARRRLPPRQAPPPQSTLF